MLSLTIENERACSILKNLVLFTMSHGHCGFTIWHHGPAVESKAAPETADSYPQVVFIEVVVGRLRNGVVLQSTEKYFTRPTQVNPPFLSIAGGKNLHSPTYRMAISAAFSCALALSLSSLLVHGLF
jgi:hypothetical protein